MSRRKSEWDRFRKSHKVRGEREIFPSLGDKHKQPATTDLSFLTPEAKLARNEARSKELAIRNSMAPASIPERHYPKEFTIPKKKENEE